MTPLRPGATIGIIGGGQLGRMLAGAAGTLGFRTIILDPAEDAPAAQFANRLIVAAYDDPAALDALSQASDVVTYEFENVPLAAADHVTKPLAPPAGALDVAQDRLSEKQTMDALGIPIADYRAIDVAADLTATLEAFGGGVLKTRRFGYDGKGQQVFPDTTCPDPQAALDATGAGPWVLERLVAFDYEVSVICARAWDGTFVAYDISQNAHEGGILRRSTVPAALDDARAAALVASARRIADHLDYVGVLAVEAFVTPDAVLVNEIAPRVHNSGHWTPEACHCGQFEQHIRAITGLPLSDTTRHHNCTMDNLLGHEASDLAALAAAPGHVTLYGKGEAREGRKMGHVTRLGKAVRSSAG